MADILYRSAEIEVRREGDGDVRVVTFDSYHEQPGLDRPGFGEAYLASRGIAAIHVLSNGNDWFQQPEMATVLRLIRAACTGSASLMTYGSSMGGYAAIRFADALGARTALALSPQYSLDPRKVPFETRWAQDQRRLDFSRERPLASGARTILAYDPAHAQDRAHALRFADEIAVEQARLPFAGHPVGAFLVDVDLLDRLVMTALDGSFAAEPYCREAHRRRATSPQWLAQLGASQPPWRQRCALALAHRAATLAPERPPVLDALALRLAAAGQYDEAIAIHRRVLAIEPIADYYWGLGKTLLASGDIAGAMEVGRTLQQLAPSVAGYHAWTAKLQEMQGDHAGALADLRLALARDPANPAYRLVVRKLGWQVRLGRWKRRLLGQAPLPPPFGQYGERVGHDEPD